jgi:hypothetical protein
MPTVLRVGPYRLFFYSGDRYEPPHVHVERDDEVVKVWLDPVRVDRNAGFRPSELRKIDIMVGDNQEKLLEAWHDYFSP